MTVQPADGTAVILHLIEAIRSQSGELSDTGFALTAEVEGWLDALDRFIEQAAPADAPAGWEARRWREVVEGDRVSAGGVEAEVLSTMTSRWHVDPRSSEYRPEPLEHDITRVRLSFRPDQPYDMPPDGEVEVLRGEKGRDLDKMLKRGAFAAREQERAEVLGHWASEAAQTLAAAGLQPEEIS